MSEHITAQNMSFGFFCNIRDRKLTNKTDIENQTKNTSWGTGKGAIYFACFSFSLCLVLDLPCKALTQETHKTSNKTFINCISHNTAKHFPIALNYGKPAWGLERQLASYCFWTYIWPPSHLLVHMDSVTVFAQHAQTYLDRQLVCTDNQAWHTLVPVSWEKLWRCLSV